MSAPGSTIMSTLPSSRYGFMTGTSMATPIVSGAAGLVASILGATDRNFLRAVQVGAATVVHHELSAVPCSPCTFVRIVRQCCHCAQIKDILMSSGDFFTSLEVRQGSRLTSYSCHCCYGE
jgi:hypothetical protein